MVTRGLNLRLQRRSKQKAVLSTWGPKETVSRCRMIHLRQQEVVVGILFLLQCIRMDNRKPADLTDIPNETQDVPSQVHVEPFGINCISHHKTSIGSFRKVYIQRLSPHSEIKL